jgi:hypothetical protein
MRVLIYTHDPLLTLARLPEEAKEWFGEDVLEEDGIEVPDELVLEISRTYEKLCELSAELKKYRKE